MIPRCIHELHLLNTIFIMAYEMSVVFTVCCVAPPGVPNEIRYQLTNPLNVICFRTDILRPSYKFWITFLCINQVWYRCFVFSLLFCQKIKESFFHYRYDKKFLVSQEIIYLFFFTNFHTSWSTLKNHTFTYFSITLRKEISYSLISLKIKFREDWNVKTLFLANKFPYVEEIARSYAFPRLPKRVCKSRNITLPCSIVRCLSITWRMVRQ